jgi:hypothetical protein
MPFVNPKPGTVKTIAQPEQGPLKEGPSVGETFGAAFRQENSFVSAASTGFGGLEWEAEKDYDPFASNELEGYEMFAESFVDSTSKFKTGEIKMVIDQELMDRDTLSSSGFTGFVAQVAAGFTDPIYLPLMLTGIGEARAMGSALKAGVSTAAIGAAAEIPAELAKHATQETRTLEESAFNIGGAAILSGLLGGAVKGLSNKQFKDLSKKAEEMNDQDLSMGAAQVSKSSMEDLELVNAAGLQHWGVSPLVRTQTSPSLHVRTLAASMMETPLVSKGNIEGKSTTPVGGSVETRIKRWDSGLVEGLEDTRRFYMDYRRSTSKTALAVNDFVMRNRKEKLSATEFRVQVGKALRNGDDHAIPEVAKAAKSFRAKVFDPLKDAAIEGKILPEDVKVSTAPSYFTRVYRTGEIVAKSDKFDDITTTWLKGIRETAQRKLEGRLAEPARIDRSIQDFGDITIPEKVKIKDIDATTDVPASAKKLWDQTAKKRRMIDKLLGCLDG